VSGINRWALYSSTFPQIAGGSLPGFFSIAVVTSSDRGQFLCGFSFNFRGFSRGDGGLITDWYKGNEGGG
jgi:hypothetical protein